MLDDCDFHTIVASLGTPAGSPKLAGPLRASLLRGVGERRERLIVLNIKAPADIERTYADAGFLVYEDSYRAIRAVGALNWLRQRHAMQLGRPPVDQTRTVALGHESINEHRAKQMLGAAGVPVVAKRLAGSADAAVEAAAQLGYPVVLKIVSPDLPHKTEIGGVLLNLPDEQAVRTAYSTIIQRALEAAPKARIDGVLVAAMAARGVETIIGVTRDPTFGPVVMFGVGGIFVEIFHDVSFRLAPFDVSEARRMIDEIKGRALLYGARGMPECDIEVLAKTLAAVSQLAAANPSIESIDINPFLVLPKGHGGLALDALIVTAAVSA